MRFLGAAPADPGDIVTKSYVDGLGGGGAAATGMLEPVQAHTNGTETYTISAGSVTQINGTTVQGRTMYVGDRILVITAPTSSGTGTSYSRNGNPGNGIYEVTSTAGSNLAVSRAADLSGSVNPSGLSVFSDNASGDWMVQALFACTADQSTFVWGTDGAWWTPLAGRNLQPDSVYIGQSGKIGFWNNSAGVSTYLNVNGSATAEQQLELPAATSGTLLARVVSSVTSTLTFANADGTEYVYLLKQGAIPTLPTAVGNTAFYRVKNTTSAPITLLSAGGTIDGSTSISLRPDVSVDLVSDGTNYFVI